MTVRDLDLDGDDDLVITHFSTAPINVDGKLFTRRPLSISILTNQSAGSASKAPTYSKYHFEVVTEKLLNDWRLAGDSIASTYWFDKLLAGHVTVDDINGDDYPDLVITVPALRKLAVVYNQGPSAVRPFEFLPFDTDPTKLDLTKTLVIDSPTTETAMPLISRIGDFNGDGFKDIATYAAHYNPETPTVKQVEYLMLMAGKAPLDPKKARYAFDTAKQTTRYGTGFRIGLGVWDGLREGTKLFDHLLPITGTPFYDAPSDRLTDAGVASHLMNAGRVMQVSEGDQDDPRSTLWFGGEGEVYSFRYDSSRDLFVLIDQLGNVDGRGAGFDIAKVGDQQALVLRAGKEIRYEPSDRHGAVTNSIDLPALSHPQELGAWVRFVPNLGGAPALLTLSRFQRPGEQIQDSIFDYNSLAAGKAWSQGALLLIERAELVISPAGKQQVKPLLESVDHSKFQAIPINASAYQQPAVETISYGETKGQALLILESGTLKFYHLNAPGYSGPSLHINWAAATSNLMAGLRDSGKVIFQKEGAVLNVRVTSADPPRYLEAWQGSQLQAVLPVGPLIPLAGGTEQLVTISDVQTLAAGKYTFRLWNSSTSAELEVEVVNPFKPKSTNQDRRANRPCGIVESTISGRMFPSQFRVKVEDFPIDKLEAVQLVRQNDGSIIDLLSGASPARYDSGEIIFSLPGVIGAGNYRIQIKAGGYWRRVPGTWQADRGAGSCNQQAKAVNDLSDLQADDTTLYLDQLRATTGKIYNAGSVDFLGEGFIAGDVQSVVLKQGSTQIWDEAVKVSEYGRRLKVDWGDLTGKLAEGVAVDVEFYAATRTEIETEGAPKIGLIRSWRTPKKGFCKTPPTPEISGLSATLLAPGSVITITGKGLAHTGMWDKKILLTMGGAKYRIGGLGLTDTWYREKQSNDGASLSWVVPADLTPYKIADEGGSIGGRGGPTSGLPAVGVLIAVEFIFDSATATVAGIGAAGYIFSRQYPASIPSPRPSSKPASPKSGQYWLVKYVMGGGRGGGYGQLIPSVFGIVIAMPEDASWDAVSEKAKEVIILYNGVVLGIKSNIDTPLSSADIGFISTNTIFDVSKRFMITSIESAGLISPTNPPPTMFPVRDQEFELKYRDEPYCGWDLYNMETDPKVNVVAQLESIRWRINWGIRWMTGPEDILGDIALGNAKATHVTMVTVSYFYLNF